MSDLNDEILNELSYMQIMGQDTSQNVGRCNHCGNTTVHLTKTIYYYKDDHENDFYEEKEEKREKGCLTYELTWIIQECVTCKGLLLKEKPSYEDFEWDNHYDEFKILYPVSKTFSDSLPSPVMKVYEAALKVKTEPNSFAFLAGQTLEFVCRHEQAQGETFNQKLNYLAEKGRIPNTLAEMAHQVRLLRNLAVHDAEVEITEKDVPIILEFLEAILEYLYVAPAKIEAVQKRLKKNYKRASSSVE